MAIFASIAAWFTPTVLFCATNLIIATIFIASNNNNKTKHHQHDHDHTLPPQISRVPSFLDRARSFKLPSYTTTEAPTYSSSSPLAQSIHISSNNNEYLFPSEPEIILTQPLSQPAHAPSLFERVKSFRISSTSSTQPETVDLSHVTRSKSEKSTAKKSKVEMKKSRSEMRMSERDDENVDVRRPATARERRGHEVDEEVDARADDFISRFKQQLKLQRLESLVRYKEMLNRSS